jgi:hypothetical protein
LVSFWDVAGLGLGIGKPIIARPNSISNSMPLPNTSLAHKLQVTLSVTIPMRLGNFFCRT